MGRFPDTAGGARAGAGLTPEAFALAFGRVDLVGHLATSQAVAAPARRAGFPTLGLMQGERVVALPVSSYLGEPAAFADHITSLMG